MSGTRRPSVAQHAPLHRYQAPLGLTPSSGAGCIIDIVNIVAARGLASCLAIPGTHTSSDATVVCTSRHDPTGEGEASLDLTRAYPFGETVIRGVDDHPIVGATAENVESWSPHDSTPFASIGLRRLR